MEAMAWSWRRWRLDDAERWRFALLRRRWGSLSNTLGVVAALWGCSQSEAEEEAVRAVQQAQVSAACSGVWQGREIACVCPSGFPLNTPTCAAADCRQSELLVLASDGQSANLSIQASPSEQQFSVIGPAVSRGSWQLTPELELSQDFSARSYTTSVACDGDTLVRNGAIHYQRAAAEFADALTQGLESGELTNVSY